MKAPGTGYVNHPDLGTDPQPATFDKLVNLPDTDRGDWGGVHINSGSLEAKAVTDGWNAAKEATTQVSWSDKELQQLIDHICRDEKKEPESMNEICHYLA
eukprot:gene5245-6695_t